MKTIRWGMIGCGDVTELKSGPALYKAEHSMLHGVAARNIDKVRDYAKRHNVLHVYDSPADLVNDPAIDIVYIATPPSTHKEYALLACSKKKHCYIEKPVAFTYDDGMEILQATQAAGVKGFVAYYRRRLPQFLKVKSLIESGAIGAPRLVILTLHRPPYPNEVDGTSWRIQPSISGGGVFMDVAVHVLDALDYILGEITDAKGLCANQSKLYEPEDTVTACFKFKSGVSGVGSWCFSTEERADRIEIVGDKGTIELALFNTTPVVVTNSEGRTEHPFVLPENIQLHLIQSIVDELNGTDTCPSTIESALRTARVCDLILG